MKQIIQLGDPVLEKQSIEIEDVNSKEIQELIDEMLRIVEVKEESTAGLSAPQIGKNLRVAICRRMDLKDEDENPRWEIMINPKLIYKSPETTTFWEGCLSIKKGDLFGRVTRPKRVTVEFLDRKGNSKTLDADEYFSHVVQHEVDHLDGILFLKYVLDPKELYTAKELDKMSE
ncbi:MAG TPA: peptide deformylase [Candidatus Dojkabacteria bacterium]|jgi:peptide deformylase